MADETETSEGEAGGPVSAGANGAALAVALRRRKARNAAADPEVDEFLREQTRLTRLQSEHLHEQRTLVLSRLRWGRFSDRMRALLQTMTALVGAAVVALVAAMAWQAHEAHGLVIEAFSTPPDLARVGLTGQVAASRFLDKLEALQTATATSDRPTQSYESDWGSDFKVEIPDTGLTFSEFDKLLRERLGNVSHVSGEVIETPDGIAVTARMGDAPPQTFSGPVASFDDLERKAAEAVYGQSQPYRYAEYLERQGRWREAIAVVADLAAHGPASERGWAFAKWAEIDLNYRGDPAAALRHASLGLGYGPASDLAARIAQVNSVIWAGHDETALAVSKALDVLAQKRLPDTSDFFYLDNKLLSRSWLLFMQSDYAASARSWASSRRDDPLSAFNAIDAAMAATTYAMAHDLPAARASFAVSAPVTEPDSIWEIAQGAFPALPGYWMAAETGRWDQALTDVRAMDAALEAGKAARPIYGLMQQVWVWPLEARALAHTGDAAGAQALIARTAPDCDLCLRVRGEIAASQGDWAGAERAFAEAARQAPSLPLAYTEWGRMRLERGDAPGAVAVLRLAETKAARFADPPEALGEALIAEGDAAGAAKALARAEALAPNWGLAHLKHGEALAKLGRPEAAQAELKTAAGLDLTPAARAEVARQTAR